MEVELSPNKNSECEANHQTPPTEDTNKHKDVKKYKCDKCKYRAFKKGQLKSHKKRTHSRYESRKFFCETCGFRTNRLHSFRRHMNIHMGLEKVRCELCDFVALNKGSFHKHKIKYHTISPNENGEFCCKMCDYITNSGDDLKEHINIHNPNDEQKYTCELCCLEWDKKSKLDSHMNVHTKEFTYECNDCGFVTYRRKNLGSHIRTFHKRKLVNGNTELDQTKDKIKEEIIESDQCQPQLEVKEENVKIKEEIIEID